MHVTHMIHHLGPGGAEQVLVELARVAHAGGFSMSVISLMGDNEQIHARGLERVGVEVWCVGLGTRWDPSAFLSATRLARELGPDLIHTHLKHADLVGAFVARRLEVPQVSTLHVIEENVKATSAAKRWLAGRVRAAAADRTITVSDAQRAWYLDNFPARADRVVTIYNGVARPRSVAPEAREKERKSLGLAADDIVAANVAIMRPGKGHEDLLAASRLLPEPLRVHFLLVGDGEERRRLEDEVGGDPRLAQRVHFTGYRTDVPTLLQSVDLVVHPTLADALPTALIHALATGVPVIASDVGGVGEVVGESAGILLPPRNPELLARCVQELVEDPERRAAMGAAGRRRFEVRFEASIWAARLGDLYRELTASTSPR